MASIIAFSRELAAPYQDSILRLFSPDLPANYATKGWAMTDLGDALLVVALYLAVVGYGLYMKSTETKEDTENEKKKEGNSIWLFQIVYNVSQVALCGYMVYGAIATYIKQGLSPICNPVDWDDADMGYWTWVFYMSKYLDFFDTVQIVVRRKWKQLSFLHVYHHVSILLVYWMLVHVGHYGEIYLTIVLNGTIHFFMYFYYANTLVGIRPWWKKYLTMGQMVQFMMMNAQAAYLLWFGCPYPPRVVAFYLIYIQSLFWLFKAFFNSTYKKSERGAKEGADAKKEK
jgi:elongation of very long chain fatty acids protein 4